ncbi:MAG: glycoside hydrolase family 127 protein [Bacteroidales bacterium]
MNKILMLAILPALFLQLQAQSYVPEKVNPRMKLAPAAEIKAYAFNLHDVRLLEGSPFRNAMERDSAYLVSIEPDRLLHRFHLNAGLPVKGEIYGGWETMGLSGHTLGHYLSACALFYAATDAPEFKRRVDYIVHELKRCQDARQTGYVGAIPNEDSIFSQVARGEIRSGGFDLNVGWSPWYTVHKVMAGLVDAYLYCGNEEALAVVLKMSDWTAWVLKDLSREQLLKMLNCEYGGMNDVLVNIYAITGDKKYLDLSYKFHDEFVMGKLAKGIDPMPGKHSNTNVPKAIGTARRFEITEAKEDSMIASFFWETMVHHHSYVIGGNSSYEYCGEADKLNDRLSDNTCETCNTYNMLKLTRHLFCMKPASYLMDYYERALYNHILASQNPNDGMMCYFVPLRMGTHKEFSDPFNTFTCCVGSGMENHSKYTENIFYESKDGGLYVNLFIPSELNWKERSSRVRIETKFPENNQVTISFSMQKSKKFPLYIRSPKWANKGVKVLVNGAEIKAEPGTDGYLVINRKWSDKDKAELILTMDLYTESIPDNKNRIAFLYGPVVLAAQLGDSMPDPVYGTPVLLTDNRNIHDWMLPVANNPLEFKMSGVGKPFDAAFKPFYKTYDQYYSVYFDFFTTGDWKTRQTEYEAEKKRQQEIEKMTIDDFRIGEMQPERDHNLQSSEQSYVDMALGRMGREARRKNYFSFDMKVLLDSNCAILLTYIGDDKNRKFDILVDGTRIATVDWNGGAANKFYDEVYPVPVELIKGKNKISVRIEANYDRTAGRIFGCRTIIK